MARDHARIQTAIWRDPDFRALPMEAQWSYLAVISQEALTYVGVLDFRPKRLAALADGLSRRRVEAALVRLTEARFIVIDHDTEELLARSYVRHDGVMDRVNMGKAVARALDRIVSLPLRAAVMQELATLYSARPNLQGFVGLGELNPSAMDHITAMTSTIPFPIPSRRA